MVEIETQKDTEVFDLLNKELERQRNGIELIASENFTSLQVLQAMGTCPTNKYAEGYPGKRYYGGCEVVDEIETLAIERLKKVFNCSWANVEACIPALFFLVLMQMSNDTQALAHYKSLALNYFHRTVSRLQSGC